MATSGGQIGNQNARKAKLFEGAIKRALARKYGSVDLGLDAIADALIADAVGDQQARRDMADRIDGKPAQSLSVGGDEDNPLRVETIVRKIVDHRTGQP